MGDDVNNPFVPFQINYIQKDAPFDEFTPLDPYTAKCSEPFNVRKFLSPQFSFIL
jgi:hypothetical protein